MEDEERKRVYRARMNFLIKELKAGRLEITEHNREEFLWIMLDACWARLVACPSLFILASPEMKRDLPHIAWEIALKAFFKAPHHEEYGPHERPLWQKAMKPDL